MSGALVLQFEQCVAAVSERLRRSVKGLCFGAGGALYGLFHA
jgi:hypothetical protein